MSDRYMERVIERHWERKRCKLCKKHERTCAVCAGVI